MSDRCSCCPACADYGGNMGSLPIARNANADRLAEKFRRLAADIEACRHPKQGGLDEDQ